MDDYKKNDSSSENLEDDIEQAEEDEKSDLQIILSKDYLAFLWNYIILDIRIIVTFPIWPLIVQQAFKDDQNGIDDANSFFTRMNSLSFLVCPLTGLICDKLSLPRIKSASFIMIFIIVIEATISFLPLIEAPWPV